ncbi:hypothetical protein M0R45_007125 [Rubus argutus]|uniref:MHC class I antigen n=1 Tax=Rubus argutus TaxID=59490 RepID=A0AAW1YU18_RUBAR
METEHRRRPVDGDVSRRRRDGSGDALEFWVEDPPSGIATVAYVGRRRFGWCSLGDESTGWSSPAQLLNCRSSG